MSILPRARGACPLGAPGRARAAAAGHAQSPQRTLDIRALCPLLPASGGHVPRSGPGNFLTIRWNNFRASAYSCDLALSSRSPASTLRRGNAAYRKVSIVFIRSTSTGKTPAPSHRQWPSEFLRSGAALTAALVTAAAAVVVPVQAAQAAPDPDGASPVHSLRGPVTDQHFYFVMGDRFSNGGTANDNGGLGADPMVTGFDPTRQGLLQRRRPRRTAGAARLHPGPRHRRDLADADLQEQGGPARGRSSAGYHGYWITDFTQVDPHLGTNQDLTDARRRRARPRA